MASLAFPLLESWFFGEYFPKGMLYESYTDISVSFFPPEIKPSLRAGDKNIYAELAQFLATVTSQ